MTVPTEADFERQSIYGLAVDRKSREVIQKGDQIVPSPVERGVDICHETVRRPLPTQTRTFSH